MTLKQIINNFLFYKNYKKIVEYYNQNSYFDYKFDLLLELNYGLMNDKNIEELELPKKTFLRIDKIKFKSNKDEIKEEYYPNYKLFKFIDLIEEKGLDNKEVINKYNDLKEYYKELFDTIYTDDDFNEMVLKLDYSITENKLERIKNQVKEFSNTVTDDKSASTKLSLLLENLTNTNRRNLIFKEKDLTKIEKILTNLTR